MKKLIAQTLLAAVPTLSMATTPVGCEEACANNALAVFSGKSEYVMKVDDAAHAHIDITWRATRKSKLKPVAFEGTAAVRLRDTKVHRVHFDASEPCKVVVNLVEFRGGHDFDFYQVTLRNKLCTA